MDRREAVRYVHDRDRQDALLDGRSIAYPVRDLRQGEDEEGELNMEASKATIELAKAYAKAEESFADYCLENIDIISGYLELKRTVEKAKKNMTESFESDVNNVQTSRLINGTAAPDSCRIGNLLLVPRYTAVYDMEKLRDDGMLNALALMDPSYISLMKTALPDKVKKSIEGYLVYSKLNVTVKKTD